MLELKGLSLESADHLISAAVSSFFQHPVPNTLCRPRPCLRDLCQTFLSEARAGKVPDLLRTTFEKGVSHPWHSAPQWLHVIYRKRQQTFRAGWEMHWPPLVWNGNLQKCQKIALKAHWKADTGTTEPAPADPFQWILCCNLQHRSQ